MNPIVIGLSGKIGAGKTTIAQDLQHRYGFWNLSFSRILRRILLNSGIHRPKREELTRVGKGLRNNFGADVLSQMMIREIRSDPEASLVVLDGMRFLADHETFAKTLPGYAHVHIHTDLQLRLLRVRNRAQKLGESNFCLGDLIDQDRLESEAEIDTLGGATDLLIVNNDSIHALKRRIDILVNEIQQRISLAL